ncbi:MAG: ACT domain-containing protein [Clostridia bacterium]
MKAIVSVIGKDKKGIIAKVTTALYDMQINVEDISQTIMQDYFTMIMMVDMANQPLTEINKTLQQIAQNMNVDIRIQHEDIFNCMHKI